MKTDVYEKITAQIIAELQFSGDLRQGFALDQTSTEPAQLALPRCGKACVKRIGDDEIDDRVAEELQPLVVALAAAAMRQGKLQQRRIFEFIANTPAQLCGGFDQGLVTS